MQLAVASNLVGAICVVFVQQGGECYNCHFNTLRTSIIRSSSKLQMFLASIERGFRRVQLCLIWIPYAKVTRVQSFIGR